MGINEELGLLKSGTHASDKVDFLERQLRESDVQLQYMPAGQAFDLYAKSTSKKKSSKRQPREGCSNPSAKRSQIEDPPMPTPTKETTPPPAPAKETSSNQDPPAPVEQTPPPAHVDLTPPASTDQQHTGRREEASREDLMGVVLNSAKDRLSRITKHRRSRKAI
ncbi:uncharacterized protein LOC133806217 [Humulus lupulus]|uniref:uncharacterized protein LOC133806217 n=1 Tax=Humulus lupulus TaxID=3486 RepID=UPI002B40DF2A|nr:uncharacterized protein LOC133806217 [Humulus lupulus]